MAFFFFYFQTCSNFICQRVQKSQIKHFKHALKSQAFPSTESDIDVSNYWGQS